MGRAANPPGAREVATQIVTTLRDAGHVAYFAGGCVRDELLGLRPTDYDVATDATPDRIRALFRRTNEVGEAFGVILVHLPAPDGTRVNVEVATFRSDGPYSDRRRPDQVTFSDPESDARRRDFTVNALFLDPLGKDDPCGTVIDYVGGRTDLAKRILRAVGDPAGRLAEDHLRALRAARFAARLGFEVEPITAAAIMRHASELAGVSRERIGDEVRRMMAHPSRARAIEFLTGWSLDAPVLNEAARPGAPFVALSGLGETCDYPTCLAAWSLDRGVEPGAGTDALVSRWRAALCLSNDETASMKAALVAFARLEAEWSGLPVAGQKRLAACAGFESGLRLFELRTGRSDVRKRVGELASTRSGIAPEPYVNGDDLISLGMKPGPGFKAILDGVYDAQLEDRVGSRDEAMELAARLRVRP